MASEELKNIFSMPSCDNRPMWDIWLSGFQLPALTVADELNLFEVLRDQCTDTEGLANRLRLSTRAIEALLGVLVAAGFLVKKKGLFHLTQLARNYLLPDSPFYWGGVLHTVKHMPVSHAMIWDAVHSNPGYENRKKTTRRFTDDWQNDRLTEDEARKFTEKMHSHAFASAVGLSHIENFENIDTILDMGGGSGCYSIALAATHPGTSFTIADLPPVCKIAKEYISRYGLSDRISTLPMNMFEDPWPHGFDAIFFSDIFHDWSIDTCRWLARSSLENLPVGGRIYLHEVVLNDDKSGPRTASAYSLAMLAVTEGQQYTTHELETILEEAGFVDINCRPAYGYHTLVSAQKPC